jgi:hypothetical protein
VAEPSSVLRIVGVEPEGYQLSSGAWPVISIGAWSSSAEDADGLACQYLGAEPCAVHVAVASCCCCASCLLCLACALGAVRLPVWCDSWAGWAAVPCLGHGVPGVVGGAAALCAASPLALPLPTCAGGGGVGSGWWVRGGQWGTSVGWVALCPPREVGTGCGAATLQL